MDAYWNIIFVSFKFRKKSVQIKNEKVLPVVYGWQNLCKSVVSFLNNSVIHKTELISLESIVHHHYQYD